MCWPIPTASARSCRTRARSTRFKANERQNALTPFRFESGADPAAGPADLRGRPRDRRGRHGGLRAVPPPGCRPYDVTTGSAPPTFTNAPRRPRTRASPSSCFPTAPADVRILTIRNHGTRRTALPRRALFRHRPRPEPGRQPRQSRRRARRGDRGAAVHQPAATISTSGWAFAATSLTAAMTETVRTRFLGGAGRDLTDPVMVETGCAGFGAGRRRPPRRRLRRRGRGAGRAARSTSSVVLGQSATQREALMAASHLRDPAAARAALKATRGLVGRAASAPSGSRPTTPPSTGW